MVTLNLTRPSHQRPSPRSVRRIGISESNWNCHIVYLLLSDPRYLKGVTVDRGDISYHVCLPGQPVEVHTIEVRGSVIDHAHII